MADLVPNTEIVAVSYLKALNIVGNAVATDLPGPDSNGNYSWASTGFIRVGGIFENINYYTTRREAIITLECYAYSSNANRPPYLVANTIAEKVVQSTLPNQHYNVLKGKLELLPRYYPVSILEVTIANGPRRDVRLVNDNRAVYLVDLRLIWVALPTN